MSTETKTQKTVEDYLQNRKIQIKPIIKDSGWLPRGHDGEFMFSGTQFSTQLPISRVSGQFIHIMDKDEQKAFEKELALKEGDLSFYSRQSPFWSKFRVTIEKEGKELDLSKPYDYIAYLVLQQDKRIAKSWAERGKSGEYRFALVDPEEEITVKASKADINLEAYKIFAKISDNRERMQDLIKVMTGNKTKSDKAEFLKSEIEKLIEKNAKAFVDAYNDPHLSMKIIIEKALDKGALERTSNRGYKVKGTEDADAIGETLSDTIQYLLTKSNSDVLLRIKSQISEK